MSDDGSRNPKKAPPRLLAVSVVWGGGGGGGGGIPAQATPMQGFFCGRG